MEKGICTIEIGSAAFLFVVINICLAAALYYLIRKEHKYTYLFTICFAVYLFMLIDVTMFPITFGKNDPLIFQDPSYVQMMPGYIFKCVGNDMMSEQIIGNILLLMPMYMFVRVIFEGRQRATVKAAAVCMFISFYIEMMQFYIDMISGYPNRICDVDDVILNTIGILASMFLYMILGRIPMKHSIFMRKPEHDRQDMS